MKVNHTVIFLIVALLFLSFAKAEPSVSEKVFTVESGGTLYLDSDSGSVNVESHDSDKVKVLVKKKGKSVDDFKVESSQDGNDVKVSGRHDRSGFNFGGYSSKVKFIIKVPENYNVDLRTGGGSIEVSDLRGKVNANTSGGSIELGSITGDVDVKTSGGSIKVDDVAGNIDAHTSGGSIKASLSQQPSKDSRLTTSGGSIKVYLASSISVAVDASTSGGRVKSELPVDGTVKRSKIKGAINGGGPELYLRTSGGSVSVMEL